MRSGPLVVGAAAGDLLNAMMAAHLAEQGLDPAYCSEPWCNEVMRLHPLVTRGERVWAAPDTVGKVRRPDGSRKSVRTKPPSPSPFWRALIQREISGWPRAAGLNLGEL